MILTIYREEVAAVVAALPPESAVAIHFRYILRTMERKELVAVDVVERV